MADSWDQAMLAYADKAVEYAREKHARTLDFSGASIEALDEIAEEVNVGLMSGAVMPPAELDSLSKVIGGYFGEVIRRQKGGTWGVHPEQQALGLQFGEGKWIFPPSKAHKRLIDGRDHNLVEFYQVVMAKLGG